MPPGPTPVRFPIQPTLNPYSAIGDLLGPGLDAIVAAAHAF